MVTTTELQKSTSGLLARKGAAEVFQRSKGFAGEAMKGNPTMPVILRVDASKLTFRREPLKLTEP